MPQPDPKYSDDAARLEVLESFEPDALEDDPELAAIVRFASRLTGMPIAQVTLVEELRQRFLAGEGLDVKETSRDVSFCDKAMRSNDLMEIRDAQIDPLFADNGLVTDPPNIRYYAGQPLISSEGAPLGALCVIDTQPHSKGLDDFQKEGLAVLAQAVMRRLQFRRDTVRAQHEIEEREQRMKRIIEGVPQIAWSADASGNFDYYNARWKEEVGAEPPSTAEGWQPHIHPEDWESAFAEWSRSFASGEEYEAQFRLKRAEGDWGWVLAMAVPVAEGPDGSARWFGTVTDIDETHKALEARDTLARELSHRIKNIFAVVTGLATLKARRAPEHADFAADLANTLRALGRAHEFVQPDTLGKQECIKAMFESLFAPYREAKDKPRILVSGADAEVSARAATPLALIFHELATNSAKYGALSNDNGHVTLDLVNSDAVMVMTWTEVGGPPAAEPEKTGFGTRLVEMSVTGQLQGSWDRTFDASGMVVQLTVPKASLAG